MGETEDIGTSPVQNLAATNNSSAENIQIVQKPILTPILCGSVFLAVLVVGGLGFFAYQNFFEKSIGPNSINPTLIGNETSSTAPSSNITESTNSIPLTFDTEGGLFPFTLNLKVGTTTARSYSQAGSYQTTGVTISAATSTETGGLKQITFLSRSHVRIPHLSSQDQIFYIRYYGDFLTLKQTTYLPYPILGTLIPTNDPLHFTPLSLEFGKDNNAIWYEDRILTAATSTFHIIGSSPYSPFGTDKARVYVEENLFPLAIDPITATSTGPNDISDKNYIYLLATFATPPYIRIVAQFDAHKYTLLRSDSYQAFLKSKNQVVRVDTGSGKSTPLLGVDPSSFTFLGTVYAKDKNSVWYASSYGGLQKLESADAASFFAINPKVLDDDYHVGYGKDKNLVFRRGISIPDADPNSFVADIPNDQWYNYFSKDKNHVYYLYGDDTTASLDPVTFEVIDDGSQKDCGYRPYVKDANGIYTFEYNSVAEKNILAKLEGVDKATFEILGMNYSRDKNHVYYRGTVQPDLDPKTFRPECGIG